MIQVDVAIDYRPKIDLYYRTERNRWILDYWLPPDNKKRMTLTLPKHFSKMKAVKAKEEKYAQLREGRLTEKEADSIPTNLTIENAIQEYKRITFLGKSEKTKEHDSAQLRTLFEFFKREFGHNKIHEIKTADILKYRTYLIENVSLRKVAEKKYKERLVSSEPTEERHVAEQLRTTGMAAATARGLLRDMKKVFTGLFLHGAIKVNPYQNIPALDFAMPDLVRRVTPTSEDLRKILSAPYKARSNVDFPIKEFVEFLAETGARDDEAINLEWTDIVDGIWYIRHKPNCPTRFGIGWAPKWSKERKVVLSSRALQVLSRIEKHPLVLGYVTLPQVDRLIARSQGVKPKPIGYPAQFVFSVKDYNLNNFGGRRRVEDYGKTWTMLLRQAGLPNFGPNKLHPHDFRRFKNKQDEYRGVSLKDRAAVLGHAPEVNQSNYRGEDDDQILSIKAKINQIRFEIRTRFEAGDRPSVSDLLMQESELKMTLSEMLGDFSLLFSIT